MPLVSILLGAALVTLPPSVRVGDIFVVTAPDSGAAAAEFMGRRYPAIHAGEGGGTFFLMGVDLDDPPGEFPLTLLEDGGARRGDPVALKVGGRDFPVERLTLKQEMVTPPAEVLERIEREREAAAAVYRTTAEEALWSPPFVRPVQGEPAGNFGRRRVLNGEPRSPHSGEDWSAPRGAEVRAAAAGRVRMAESLYFSGNTVLIDHGAGLVSQYFHLDEILVAEGETVGRGSLVGKVGATGRVTGPHLHFGLRLFGKRVDPSLLWALFTRENGGASLPPPASAPR